MPRFCLTIEYDGTPYSGWQRQNSHHSVQQAVETAITAFCGETVRVNGAGRTDAGVHALGQVAHIELEKNRDATTVKRAVNAHLRQAREQVVILSAHAVPDDFDARFSATKRHYIYRILLRDAPPVIDRDRVWWQPGPLDYEAMHAAAQQLVGRHDFTTFRSTHCQANSPVRTLDQLSVSHEGDEIIIRASALSFLHNQIRSFVGTLREVGAGKWSIADVAAALQAKSRQACGPVAPPQGLYLSKVEYGNHFSRI